MKKCPECNHSLPHNGRDDELFLSDYCDAPIPFGPVTMFCPCKYKDNLTERERSPSAWW
jgi:hypothetical protein